MKRTRDLKTARLSAGKSRGMRGQAVLRAALMGLCLLTVAACATSPAARDKAIEQRAQARWDALLAGDFATAYSYASPGYRSSTSVSDFEIGFRVRRVQYTAAEYQGSSCEETTCTVRMQVGYTVARPAPGVPVWESSSVIEERWINSGGEWWFLPESR